MAKSFMVTSYPFADRANLDRLPPAQPDVRAGNGRESDSERAGIADGSGGECTGSLRPAGSADAERPLPTQRWFASC